MAYGFLLSNEERESHICSNIHCSNYALFYHPQLNSYFCQFCENLISHKIRKNKN